MLLLDYQIKVATSAVILIFFLGSVLPRLYGVYERAELEANAMELLDAAEIELKIVQSRSVCPINNLVISVADLVANKRLNAAWLSRNQYSIDVQFRQVKTVANTFVSKPAFIEVRYIPDSDRDFAVLSSIAHRVSKKFLFFTKQINSRYSSTNSYIDPSTGCAVN